MLDDLSGTPTKDYTCLASTSDPKEVQAILEGLKNNLNASVPSTGLASMKLIFSCETEEGWLSISGEDSPLQECPEIQKPNGEWAKNFSKTLTEGSGKEETDGVDQILGESMSRFIKATDSLFPYIDDDWKVHLKEGKEYQCDLEVTIGGLSSTFSSYQRMDCKKFKQHLRNRLAENSIESITLLRCIIKSKTKEFHFEYTMETGVAVTSKETILK